MPKLNPFKPGHGLPPPHLAGRATQQKTLRQRLDALEAGASVNSIAMYGPRGTGKTALLGWVEQECERRAKEGGQPISVIRATAPKLLDSKEAMLNKLLPIAAAVSEVEGTAKGGVPGIAAFEGKAKMQVQDRRWDDLEDQLTAVCQETPTMLLVDEAHAIEEADQKLYQQFLNAAQAVAEHAPFLLVLAGTPGLPDVLGALKATFIERTDRLGIGLLEEREAAAAIREPLTEDGFKIADDALAFAVQDSQRYPFFLQRWGYELWGAANDQGLDQLTLADAERTQKAVDTNRIDLYESRYAELSRTRHLRAVASAVSDTFAGQDALDSGQVRQIVESALSPLLPADAELEPAADILLRQLVHLGYIWRPPGKPSMQPGIPSLMDYTRSKQQPE